jgi:hypothetical protein
MTEKLLTCNSGEYDAASQRSRDLRSAFKGIHHLKYAQYGLKSIDCFNRYANLK